MLQDLLNVVAGRQDPKGAPQDPIERVRIAVAVILLEAAHSDQECTAEELDRVLTLFKERFDLSPEHVDDLVEIAHGERQGAIDLWQFTDQVNRHFEREEKQAVMEGVWRVIHVDDRLDGYEDHFAHKIANLLRLSHKEMIEAKIRARGV